MMKMGAQKSDKLFLYPDEGSGAWGSVVVKALRY